LLAIAGCKSVPTTVDKTAATTATSIKKTANSFVDRKIFLPPIAERASLATKNFFDLQPAYASEALPQTAIPPVVLKDTYLSDALLQLMQNVPYRLYIADTVQDTKLSAVALPRDFKSALQQLSVMGNFVYRLNKNVLQIDSVESYNVVLPPLGYINNGGYINGTASAKRMSVAAAKEPYETILNNLESLGAKNITFDASSRVVSLELSRTSLAGVSGYLQQIKNEKMVVAYQVTLWRFDISPKKPLDWRLMGLTKIAHDTNSGAGIYQGAVANEDFRSVFAPYGLSVTKVESAVITTLSGTPLTFSLGDVPKTQYCKTPRYAAPKGLVTVTVQSTPQDKDVATNLFVTVQNPDANACDERSNITKNTVSLSFSHSVENPLLLYSLADAAEPASYMLFLKPRLIRFNTTMP
jgi:hypothetical protein